MSPRLCFGHRGAAYSIRSHHGYRRLPPQQGLLLLALMGREVLSYDDLYEVIYPGADDEPEDAENVLRKQLWALNNKLRSVGWSIVRVRTRLVTLRKIPSAERLKEAA